MNEMNFAKGAKRPKYLSIKIKNYIMKKTISVLSLVLLMAACSKKQSNPSKQSINTSSEEVMTVVDYSELNDEETQDVCAEFVSYLEGSSGYPKEINEAVKNLEGTLNYKYAAINVPYEDRM